MRTIAWLLLLLALFSCASTAPSRDEVIAHINEQTANSATSPGPPPSSTSMVTDARLAELQTQMTELLERIDVLGVRIQRLENTPSEPRAVAEPAVKAESLPTPPAPMPAAVVPAPVPAAAPVSAATPVPAPAPAPALTQPQGTSRVASAPTASPAPTRAKLASAAVADLYQRAIVLYGKGRVVESRKVFQQVFDADPSGDLADNALFWLGESYYAVRDYAAAIKFYLRVTSEFADQNKAPDALFKLGMAYEKNGDLALAKSAFQECEKKYPYSAPALSAKAALKRIQ